MYVYSSSYLFCFSIKIHRMWPVLGTLDRKTPKKLDPPDLWYPLFSIVKKTRFLYIVSWQAIRFSCFRFFFFFGLSCVLTRPLMCVCVYFCCYCNYLFMSMLVFSCECVSLCMCVYMVVYLFCCNFL